MQLETPEGILTIEDDELTFTPADDGPEVRQSLNPMPDSRYERGIYGAGTLVIGDHVITLKNDQAAAVVEELQRPRTGARTVKPSEVSKKSADAVKSDSDEASSK